MKKLCFLGGFFLIHNQLWNFFGMVLSDSWWLSISCEQLWTYFVVILGDLQSILKFIWDTTQGFINHYEFYLG